MYFEPYFHRYPNIAKVEFRTVNVDKRGNIPRGSYLFVETYCNEKKCDCRRSLIQVLPPPFSQQKGIQAFISFGWEPAAFYRDWGRGSMSESDLDWIKGPGLDPFQPQGPYAADFLALFIESIKQKDYQDMLLRHYAQFKYDLGMKIPKALTPHLGRYELCGCKSGKSFALCCSRRRW